jgi:hypothetical protein
MHERFGLQTLPPSRFMQTLRDMAGRRLWVFRRDRLVSTIFTTAMFAAHLPEQLSLLRSPWRQALKNH